jgi:hypothetical protein
MSLIMLILSVLLTGTAQGQGVSNRGPEWQRPAIDFELSGADGGRLLDVDDDGDLDLSVGWEESGVTPVYLNPDPLALSPTHGRISRWAIFWGGYNPPFFCALRIRSFVPLINSVSNFPQRRKYSEER